jgi:murein DD-endopeptidase MepM/ murein hydrolase activator NlpD
MNGVDMRSCATVLLVALSVLSGCTAVDEAISQDHPVQAPSGQPGYKITVGAGETLDIVARSFEVSREAVIQANHLKPPYTLRAQQILIIPPPATYRVQTGDTVAGIATTLGVDEQELARANGLQRPYKMRVGQILKIPGGVGGPGQAAAPSEELAFAGAEPPPRSAISAQPLAPPSAVSAAPLSPPMQAPAAPQASSLAPRNLATTSAPPQPFSSPTALAPQQQTKPQMAAPMPAPSTSPVAAANGAPTALLPPVAAPAAPMPAPVIAPPPASPQALAAAGASGAPHFIKPVSGSVIQGFGAEAGGTTNDGLNIAAPAGTPVQAAEGGTVIYTGNELPAFGNLVLIRHAGGWVTAYGHLATITVQPKASVTQGQAIGTVGQTGTATSPQLHFEIRQGSKPVDPAPFLSGSKG